MHGSPTIVFEKVFPCTLSMRVVNRRRFTALTFSPSANQQPEVGAGQSDHSLLKMGELVLCNFWIVGESIVS